MGPGAGLVFGNDWKHNIPIIRQYLSETLSLPPTAATYNLPFYVPHGLSALLQLPRTTTWSPSRLVEATPPAGYRPLLQQMFAALVLGWNRKREVQLIWLSMILGFIVWWWQVRYVTCDIYYLICLWQ